MAGFAHLLGPEGGEYHMLGGGGWTGDDMIKVGCQKVNLKMVFDMCSGD